MSNGGNGIEGIPPSGSSNAPEGASRFSILICSPSNGDDAVAAIILVRNGEIVGVYTSCDSNRWQDMECQRMDYRGDSRDEKRVYASFRLLAEKAGLRKVEPSSLETHGLYEVMGSCPE